MNAERQSPRLVLAAKVELVALASGFVAARFTANISKTGMFVASSELLPAGSLVKFRLLISDSDEVRGIAKVMWIREAPNVNGAEPDGMGLSFRYLDPISQEILETYIGTYRKTSDGCEPGGTGDLRLACHVAAKYATRTLPHLPYGRPRELETARN